MAHLKSATFYHISVNLLILVSQWQISAANIIPAAIASGANSSENQLHSEVSIGTITKRTCSNVHIIFEQRGFNAANIPADPVTDRPLRYCDVPPGGTCCTHTIENKLAVHAKTLLERNTKDSITKLSSVLGNRAQKFNGE